MNKNKLKKIFLLGSYHGNNFGDLEILDSILSKLYREYSITVLSKSAFKIRTKLPIQYFEEGNISFVNPFNLIKVFWKIVKSDAVIIGGGGLFFSYSLLDTFKLSAKSQLLYWINATIIAKLFGKKVFWFGVGFGPFDKFGRSLTFLAAKIVNKIYIRDDLSFELLKDKVNDKRLFASCDTVFSKIEQRKVKKNFEKRSGDFNNVVLFLFEKDNKSQLEKLINQLKKAKLKITIASSNPNKDNKFNLKLSKDFGTHFIDTSNFTIQDFRNMFSKFDLVLSMRMHALLIGFQQGLLGIGLSADISKVEELQNLLYKQPLYTNNYDVDKLLDQVQSKTSGIKAKSIGEYERYFQLSNSAFEDLLKELAK